MYFKKLSEAKELFCSQIFKIISFLTDGSGEPDNCFFNRSNVLVWECKITHMNIRAHEHTEFLPLADIEQKYNI